jgi:hypothetical protein
VTASDDQRITVELTVGELRTIVALLGESLAWWQRRDPTGALIAGKRALYDRLLVLSLGDK